MIGLRRGTVRLVAHSGSWAALFLSEARRLVRIRGVVDVQHIGSTAVPGLRAKPIIDILVGVSSIRGFRKHVQRLERLGYAWKRSAAYRNRTYFLTKGPERRRTVYLHVARYGGVMWRNDIRFRDWLCAKPQHRRRYERLKVSLARRYSDDRYAYTAGKKTFIMNVLKSTV